jgi:hypothetical protein
MQPIIPIILEESRPTWLQDAVIETHPTITELIIISMPTLLAGFLFEEKKKGQRR